MAQQPVGMLCLGMLVLAGWGCAPANPSATAQAPSPVSSAESPASAEDSAEGQAAGAAELVRQQWESQLAELRSGSSEILAIDAGAVSHELLEQLAEVDGQLTQLMIDAGGVDDQGLALVAQVGSLVHLRLRLCPISDRGLMTLAAGKLSELQILNIPHGHVSARGIKQLAGLPALRQLRLGGAQLDDAAVMEMTRLPGLRSLHLIGPSLTDAALEQLAACPQLSSFYLDNCPLSDAAWERLFAAKPNLHVHVDQLHHDRDPHRH